MGTRAQIDVRQSNKVIRIYTQLDGFPRNILPALRAAAGAGYSKPSRIARAIIQYWDNSGGSGMRIITEDRSDVSYRYIVDVSSKPWRVRQTRMEGYRLTIKPDGSIDDSDEALTSGKRVPAATRSLRIGK
jgi:hypothetical protein